MATMREKQPGMWEVRVFTGNDARGCPTQLSRTVSGTKRDAQRMAAQLEVGPGSASPAGRRVGDVLDAWVDEGPARAQSDPVPSARQEGVSYGRVAPVTIDADVYGWASQIERGATLSAIESGRHAAARNDLVVSLDRFPVDARPYCDVLLHIVDEVVRKALLF